MDNEIFDYDEKAFSSAYQNRFRKFKDFLDMTRRKNLLAQQDDYNEKCNKALEFTTKIKKGVLKRQENALKLTVAACKLDKKNIHSIRGHYSLYGYGFGIRCN